MLCLVLNLAEWVVLLATTTEVGIFEELYKGESHGMHKGTDHAQAEGDGVAQEQDDDHDHDAH